MKRSSLLFLSLFLLPFVLFWGSYFWDAPVPDPLGNAPLQKYPPMPRKHHPPDSAWLRKVARAAISCSPFRYRAIQVRNGAYTTAARLLYPVPVNPGSAEVCWGRDGWLFLLNETPFHLTEADLQETAQHAVNIGRLVQKSGRRFYFTVFPDKVSIYPEYDGWVKRWAEHDANRSLLPTAMTSAFAAAPDLQNSFINSWQPLQHAKETGGQLLYWEKDTHWNYAGMVVATRALINAIQPGLFEENSVQQDGQANGFIAGGGYDLSSFFLLQQDHLGASKYVIRRSGGDPVPQGLHWKAPQDRVIKGRTVIIHDSFVEWAAPLLTPWFEDLVFFAHERVGSPEMERSLAESDTIIWTSVERFAPERVAAWETYLGKILPAKQ